MFCGNMEEDDARLCSVCGNPFADMEDSAAAPAKGDGQASGEKPDPGEGTGPDAADSAGDAQGQTSAKPAQVPDGRRPRMTKSAPRIYGQEGDAAEDPEMYAHQGSIRRTVAPRSSEPQGMTAGGAAQRSPGRPLRQVQGTGRPAGYGQADAAGAGTGRPAGYSQADMANAGTGCPAGYGQADMVNAGTGRPAGYGQADMVNAGTGRPAGYGQADMTNAGAGRPAGYGQADMTNAGAGRLAGYGPAGAGRLTGVTPGNAGSRLAGADPWAKRRVQTARAALRSPLFLLIALLNTGFVASSIAAIFMRELNYSQIVRLLGDVDLPGQVSGYMNTASSLLGRLDSGMTVTNLVLRVPALLFCLGLWLIVLTVRLAKDRMSGVGFLLAKISVVIRMVAACIVMAAVLIVSVAIVVSAWVSGSQNMIIAAIVILVLTIIAVMMVIMYYFSYLATLKTCRINSNTGESYGKASAYAAVLQIIVALTAIISLLSGIVNEEITGIVSGVCQMGWMILLSVWIFGYRRKMKNL